jgi:hypothetical protein
MPHEGHEGPRAGGCDERGDERGDKSTDRRVPTVTQGATDPEQVRSPNRPDLVGAAEIAERLNLAHAQSVHSWRRRYSDFPEPVAQLSVGLIWPWREVEGWARATGRLRA